MSDIRRLMSCNDVIIRTHLVLRNGTLETLFFSILRFLLDTGTANATYYYCVAGENAGHDVVLRCMRRLWVLLVLGYV
ncbi:hypothetical protein HanRHA438_Chr15g0707271 [Helianthus annuus]|nr:hypothetical protein HanRHA438_Chr15g0707271 [Helianthus annuus]